MIKLLSIYKTLLKEETEEVKAAPIENILRKYKKLNKTLIQLMGDSFREHIDGIFITSGKPTTFKVHLKNHQYYFLTATKAPVPFGELENETPEVIYEATVLGKRHLLSNEGNIQRAITAISRLLRYGPSVMRKGPEGEETATPKPEKTPAEKPAKIPKGELGSVEAPPEGVA